MKRIAFKLAGMFCAAASCLALAVAAMAQDAPPAAAPSSSAGGAKPRVELKTSLGPIVLELEPDKAPVTVSNFLRYVREGFYDGTYVDSVIAGFRVEAGGWHEKASFEKPRDPLAPPPGKDEVAAELRVRPYPMEEKVQGLHDPIPSESGNGLSNLRGTIAMNRHRDSDSATSRFYINVVDNAFLDKPTPERGNSGMAVFGRVVEGMDVVDKMQGIQAILHADHPVGKVTPAQKIVIESMRLANGYDTAAIDAKRAEYEKQVADTLAEQKRLEGVRQSQMNSVIKSIEAEAGKPMTTTASGLKYVILREGDGKRHPRSSDTVKVHYWGQRIDGFEIDNSYKRGKPNEFVVGQLIPGWAEGLKQLSAGAKAKFVIPPELGYGAGGSGKDIPPNTWLVFQVELLDFVDK